MSPVDRSGGRHGPMSDPVGLSARAAVADIGGGAMTAEA